MSAARAADALVCVSRADLGAPYSARERVRHEELCALLRQHLDIEIRLQDFFGDTCANSLLLAEVTARSHLLVVDCHYTSKISPAAVDQEERVQESSEPIDPSPRRPITMRLEPESIRFHLLESALQA